MMIVACAANGAYLAGLDGVHESTMLVSVSGAPLARQIRAAGGHAWSVDELSGEEAAATRSGGAALALPQMQAAVQAAGATAVVPFKSGPSLWSAAQQLGLRVLAPPDRVVRAIENKLQLPSIAAAAGVAAPHTRTVQLTADLPTEIAAEGMSYPLVYQPAVGFAGAGTIPIAGHDELVRLVAAAGQRSVGKLSAFIGGEPVTVTGVVMGDGDVLVGMVARQLTGIAALTPAPMGSCGNEWSMPPAAHHVDAVREATIRVGRELVQRGHCGAFGLDMVLPDDGSAPVLIEVNPRWTASLSLQVQLQHELGFPTLFDAHVAAFNEDSLDAAQRDSLRVVYGPGASAAICNAADVACATAIVYNTSSTHVRVAADAQPQVWHITERGLEPGADGWLLAHLSPHASGELLVLPEAPGREVEPGGYLFRVIRRRRMAATTAASELRADDAELIEQLRRRLLAP